MLSHWFNRKHSSFQIWQKVLYSGSVTKIFNPIKVVYIQLFTGNHITKAGKICHKAIYAQLFQSTSISMCLFSLLVGSDAFILSQLSTCSHLCSCTVTASVSRHFLVQERCRCDLKLHFWQLFRVSAKTMRLRSGLRTRMDRVTILCRDFVSPQH